MKAEATTSRLDMWKGAALYFLTLYQRHVQTIVVFGAPLPRTPDTLPVIVVDTVLRIIYWLLVQPLAVVIAPQMIHNVLRESRCDLVLVQFHCPASIFSC